MTNIDIIVTYVNNQDKSWQREFKKCIETEKLSGNTNVTDIDFNGATRYRDWDNFNYFFRGVEQNCPWVNKVFLVVANKSQLPRWLDTTNPKLRIVYHEEYIPSEFLPTFNSNVIEMFFHLIPDLSDHYVLCNDDTFFINQLTPQSFFLNNYISMGYCEQRTEKFIENSLYRKTLNNNLAIEAKYFRILNKRQVTFIHKHVPLPHIKSFDAEIWSQNYQTLYNGLIASHFRHEKNNTHLLFNDLLQIHNLVKYNSAIYDRAICVNVRRPQDYYSKYKDFNMICFNDSAMTEDFEGNKESVLVFLNTLLPNKSSFEK